MPSGKFLLSTAFGAVLALTAHAQNLMSVQVTEGVLRETPSPFGKTLAKLNYGDLVDVLATQGAWSQVRGYGNVTGWVHQNTLTSKKIVSGAGTAQAAAGASASEVALAGKGFNSDIEKNLRSGNRVLNFKTIDQMETWKVSESESLRFLKDGGIRPQGMQL